MLIFVKRTPQNTPLNNAPISSRAQQPGVNTIKEGTISSECHSHVYVLIFLQKR